jgi:tRNA wybutosine-synthesizing protein 1
MENVPWHQEVVNFSNTLCKDYLSNYELACEHEHSNCILLANKRVRFLIPPPYFEISTVFEVVCLSFKRCLCFIQFKIDGEWHTWINYAKFHELVKRYYETDGVESFTALVSWNGMQIYNLNYTCLLTLLKCKLYYYYVEQDYTEKSPSWSVYGSEERGFDPEETRWMRKNNKQKDISGC